MCILVFHKLFSFFQCKIDAVEIDEEIANCAKNWFGLEEDENISIHIADGLKFVKESALAGIWQNIKNIFLNEPQYLES